MSYLRTDTVPKEFWSSYTLSIVVYVLSNWHLHGYEDSETPLQISKSSWRSNPSWEDPNFLDFIISAEINVSWWFIVSIILAHMAPGYSRSRIISQWRGLRQIFFHEIYYTASSLVFVFNLVLGKDRKNQTSCSELQSCVLHYCANFFLKTL